MPFILFGLFIVVPLIEIMLFITVGQHIGMFYTIALVIVTAILGTFLLQTQGLSTMTRAQKAMAEGRVPMDSVFDGMCLLIAGAFLLTPGFLTDSIGFLLFVPWFRRGIGKFIFKRMMASGNVEFHGFGTGSSPREGGPSAGPAGSRGSGPVIDGEFEDHTPPEFDEKGKPSADSPWHEDKNKS